MKEGRRVGRPGITLYDVEIACRSLTRQRRKVGPLNVRLELRRGSYTTIIGFLRILGYSNNPERRQESA